MTRGTEELAPSPVGLGAGSLVPRVRNLLLSTTDNGEWTTDKKKWNYPL